MSSAVRGVDVINLAEGSAGRTAMFRCPGCRLSGKMYGIHALPVRPYAHPPSWEWNGDVVRPVFSPSILSRFKTHESPAPIERVCHSFVGCNGAQPGQIIYLSDCTHELAGKVVDLEPWLSADGLDPFDQPD